MGVLVQKGQRQGLDIEAQGGIGESFLNNNLSHSM